MNGLPHRYLISTGHLSQFFYGFAANATGRCIQHALKRRVVITGLCQSEVGERIANFKALVETLATIDPVGNSFSQQRLFQHPGLGIGAIQDSNRAARVAIAKPGLGLLHDVTRLVLLIEARVQSDGVATLPLRPQTLTQPTRIAGN